MNKLIAAAVGLTPAIFVIIAVLVAIDTPKIPRDGKAALSPTATAPVPTPEHAPTLAAAPAPATALTTTPTPGPTATPALEIPPSFQGTEGPNPGWKRFQATGMRIWLPENWDRGDPNEVRAHLLESLPSLGPEFAKLAENYEQAPESIVLFAYDSTTGASGYLTNMIVSTYPAPEITPMENILQDNLDQLPSPLFQVVEQEIVAVEGYPTGRAVVETTVSGRPVKLLTYLIKRSDTIWAASYATSADEYAEMEPVFEQSIQSIEIAPGN